VELAYKPVEEEAEAVSREMEMESDMAELDLAAMQSSERQERLRPCLSIAGVLWELREGKLIDSDAVPDTPSR